jgi:hypothetical protein
MAIQMLQLLLGEHKCEDGRVLVKQFPHVASFCTFLQQQTTYKVINNDQWMSFFEFCKTVSEDLSGYDENAACTVSHSQSLSLSLPHSSLYPTAMYFPRFLVL